MISDQDCADCEWAEVGCSGGKGSGVVGLSKGREGSRMLSQYLRIVEWLICVCASGPWPTAKPDVD